MCFNNNLMHLDGEKQIQNHCTTSVNITRYLEFTIRMLAQIFMMISIVTTYTKTLENVQQILALVIEK